MFANNTKLIFENKEGNVKYYISGFNSRSNFKTEKNFIFYDSDILLEGKVKNGSLFSNKKFAFSKFDLYKLHAEIGKESYTFEQFKKDLLEEFDGPKYCIIYAKRPPRKFRKITKEEKELEMLLLFPNAAIGAI